MGSTVGTKTRIRVLIVDDILETRSNLQKLMYFEEDINIIGAASNGREGVEQATALKPDIILMDINMPVMDGIQATELISVRDPKVQVIMMSVQGEADYLRRSMLAGAREFLIKPFSSEELADSIRRVYALAGMRELSTKIEGEEKEVKLFELRERTDLYSSNYMYGRLIDKFDHFAVGIAHDLRSPLNIIVGILQSIEKDDRQQYLPMVTDIEKRIEYCRWMADSFLGASFSEKTTLNDVDLLDMVVQCFGVLESKLPNALQISIDIPKGYRVYSSADLLRLAFTNVLANSLESMPFGGALHVYSQQDQTQTRLIITDSGPGILEVNQSSLFTPGFTTKHSHTGLGLFVSKRILRHLSSTIEYLRMNDPSGATFRISLPVKNRPFSDLGTVDAKISELESELEGFRNRPVPEDMTETIDAEFGRIVSAFSNNMCVELAEVEELVRDMLHTIPPTFSRPMTSVLKNCEYAKLIVKNFREIDERLPLSLEPVSLHQIILDVFELLERKMPPEQYPIIWEVDPTLEDIEADETALKQVFMNLIRNALDAMPNGGIISVSIVRDEENAVTVISDSGVGIAIENLNKLFSLGFTTKPKGYGIGLYSTNTIISRHGGTIGVQSILGQGTSFTVRLPIRNGVKTNG